MIVRYLEDADLGDYEALWVASERRPIATIRAHCDPVACDVATRRLLFDLGESVAKLAQVGKRRPHRRMRVAA